MPGLPSLPLVGDEIKAELEAQERRSDALDSKAGIVVGFAGVLVPLSLANLHGTLAHVGAGFAGAAALLAAVAFLPRSWPTINPHALRSYLTSADDFTQLRLLDTRIVMYDQASKTVKQKANILVASVLALGLAVILTVIAGII